MKKILVLLILCLFALPVFAGVTEFMEKALNSWIGYNINDIINSWGFPTEEKTIANRHIYIWNKAWSQYIPQRVNSTVTPGYYNANVYSYTTGGYNINWYCNKTIEVDDKNNVISWSWEGNACPKNYSNGKNIVNPANDIWEQERLIKIEEKKQKKIQKAKNKQLKKEAKAERKRLKQEAKLDKINKKESN